MCFKYKIIRFHPQPLCLVSSFFIVHSFIGHPEPLMIIINFSLKMLVTLS